MDVRTLHARRRHRRRRCRNGKARRRTILAHPTNPNTTENVITEFTIIIVVVPLSKRVRNNKYRVPVGVITLGHHGTDM